MTDAPIWPAPDEVLLPAVVQDADTLQVLLVAYMNRAAYEETLATRRVTFFSRSRRELWTKGATSGNTLALVDLGLDCDRDALLVRARPAGPACHRGTTSCFGDEEAPGVGFLGRLDRVVGERASAPPESSYTARLLAQRPERVAQKVGEEAVETVIAASLGNPGRVAEEAADLLYHLLVLLRRTGVGLPSVLEVLRGRHRADPEALPDPATE